MGKNRSTLTAKYLQNALTVDPGFGGTGYAYWIGNEYPITGVITEKKNLKVKSKEERLCVLFNQFKCVLSEYEPEYVYIESMQIWSGSLSSMASASRGDLFLLQTLVGGYCSLCYQAGIGFKLLTPTQWKGQLTKEALAFRIKSINNTEYSVDHITDAVGIGISLAGML